MYSGNWVLGLKRQITSFELSRWWPPGEPIPPSPGPASLLLGSCSHASTIWEQAQNQPCGSWPNKKNAILSRAWPQWLPALKNTIHISRWEAHIFAGHSWNEWSVTDSQSESLVKSMTSIPANQAVPRRPGPSTGFLLFVTHLEDMGQGHRENNLLGTLVSFAL